MRSFLSKGRGDHVSALDGLDQVVQDAQSHRRDRRRDGWIPVTTTVGKGGTLLSSLEWTNPLSSNAINIDALHLECLIPRIDNSNYSWVGNGWAKIAAQVP